MRAVGSRQKAVGRGAATPARRWLRFLRLFPACCLLPTALCGCGDSRRHSSDQRSEKALRDPFNYSPQFEKTDETGGGLLEYDRDGMRKDLRNVFDP